MNDNPEIGDEGVASSRPQSNRHERRRAVAIERTAGDYELVSLNNACRMTSLSRTAINRWRALGKFPAAVELGDKRIAFVRAEVLAWIQDRIAERAA